MSILQKAQKPRDVDAFNYLARSLVKSELPTKENCSEGYDPDLRPSECSSIEELLTALIPKLNAPSSSIDCFKVLLATVIGLRVSGVMLWVHCVGPSSGLKTTFAKFIGSASDKCFMVSKFSGFYSGFRGQNGEDTSLLPMVNGRILIIPDLTPILQAEKQLQDDIFGEFRDIYEGEGRRIYKTGLDRNYKGVNFGCITATTGIIRKFGPGRSDIGERFLMSEINSSWDEAGVQKHEEIDTSGQGSAYAESLRTAASGFDLDDNQPTMDRLKPERAMCWGLINHLFDWMSDEAGNMAKLSRSLIEDKSYQQFIEHSAIWLEYARCHMATKGEDQGIHQPALPHRTIKQLTKLTICLCVVNQTPQLTPEIKRLVRKTVFDTCICEPLRFMNFFAVNPHCSKEVAAQMMNRSPTHVANQCHHLQHLEVLQQEFRNNGTGQRGRDMLCYDLTPKFRAYATTLGLMPGLMTAPIPVVPRGLHALLGQRLNGNSTNGHDTTVNPKLTLPMGTLRSLRERMEKKGE